MRTSLIILTSAVWAQSTCPTVQFQALPAAPLQASPATHRLLLHQPGGTYTAYEMTDAMPHATLRTIPHFEKQLNTCTPQATDLGTFEVISVTSVPAGGYFVTYSSGQKSYLDIFDANLNFSAEAPLTTTIFADMTGTGKLDAISTQTDRSVPGDLTIDISIALGIGGAKFGPPKLYPTGQVGVSQVTAADLNRDGKMDLLIMAQGYFLVYLGNGDGTLQSPITLSLPRVYGANSFLLADLNGDGNPDLVYADRDYRVLKIGLGVGNGTFGALSQVPMAAYGPGFAIGDLNGDKIPDVFFAGTIYFGDGKGGFPTQKITGFSAPNNTYAIIADFNGDGIEDVVFGVGNAQLIGGDTVSVLYGQGNGDFAALVPMAGTPLLSADFSGSGFREIVTLTGQYNVISVLKSIGDGTFKTTYAFQLQNGLAYAALAGDFNHDGKLDFGVVGSDYTPNGSGVVAIALGNGDGTFRVPIQFPAPLGAASFAAADFNRDGNLDLAVMTNQVVPLTSGTTISDSLTIFLGNGDGTFKTGATYATGPYSSGIAAADFTGDGIADLVIANNGTYSKGQADATLVLLKGNGDGTFGSPTSLPFVSGNHHLPYSVVAADLNGDGKMDLAVGLSAEDEYLNALMVLVGHGDGTFQAPSYYPVGDSWVTVADINRDGIPDLISSGTFTAHYLLGLGDGTFRTPGLIPGAAGAYTSIPLADVNHDGKLDVVSPEGVMINITPAPLPIVVTSAAGFLPSPIPPASLASLFWNGPSAATDVSITDVTGRTSPVTMLYSGASQVNFLVPSELESGLATVSVTAGGSAATAQINIAPVMPSLFTLNTSGLAAAYVTRTGANGATYEAVFTSQNGVIAPLAVDTSTTSGAPYLVLFGTGLRDAAYIGYAIGNSASGYLRAPFAGAQSSYPGLDQVNIPISGLASGYTNILINTGTQTANPVYILVK